MIAKALSVDRTNGELAIVSISVWCTLHGQMVRLNWGGGAAPGEWAERGRERDALESERLAQDSPSKDTRNPTVCPGFVTRRTPRIGAERVVRAGIASPRPYVGPVAPLPTLLHGETGIMHADH